MATIIDKTKTMKLMLSSYQTELWYDKENEWLYVYSDTIYRYKNITYNTWLVIKSGDIKFFEQITSILGVENTLNNPPKKEGLEYYAFAPNSIIMYSVNSSNVLAVGYDARDNSLYIQYDSKGKPVYKYYNVEPAIWEGLQNADSKGSYTHWFVKINSYRYEKIGGHNLVWSNETTANSGTPHPDGYMVGF